MNALQENPRKLVIAGGSGFLGQSLIRSVRAQFASIICLTRGPDHVNDGVAYVHWDAQTPGEWVRHLEGATALVNVVGRTVDCRKTPFNKKVILESRVNSVRALAEGCNRVDHPPAVWVQSATAHIFGDTEDELIDESSPIGTGFAPEVGTAWERALAEADLLQTRRVVLRISFVLGKNGGPLRTLSRLARFGLGGTTGTGRQYMSWIHEDDLNAIIRRGIFDASMSGMYVVTAPNPMTNKDFMREIRHAVHRPWSPPAPAALVRMGAWVLRTDPELALFGRRCVPTRLLSEGFQFQFPDLRNALANLLPG